MDLASRLEHIADRNVCLRCPEASKTVTAPDSARPVAILADLQHDDPSTKLACGLLGDSPGNIGRHQMRAEHIKICTEVMRDARARTYANQLHCLRL